MPRPPGRQQLFGACIGVGFDTRYPIIVGANMRTYLLEQSHAVFQAEEGNTLTPFTSSVPRQSNPHLRCCGEDAKRGGGPGVEGSATPGRPALGRELVGLVRQGFRVLTGVLHSRVCADPAARHQVGAMAAGLRPRPVDSSWKTRI